MTSHCGSDNDVNDYERGWAEGRAQLRVERDELVVLRDRLQQTIYKIQDLIGYAAEGDELVEALRLRVTLAETPPHVVTSYSK